RPAINSLEQPGAENAVIDDIAPKLHADAVAAINFSAPVASAQGIEMIRMLIFQQGFRFPVSTLLLQISFDGIASIVPHLGRGRESDSEAKVLDSPDDVHV